MDKYKFLNELMYMYYNNLNYLKENFRDGLLYYEDLKSNEISKMLIDAIVEFLKFDYDEIKLPLILEMKENLFENAISHKDSDLYSNVLYAISTEGLDWNLKYIKIN